MPDNQKQSLGNPTRACERGNREKSPQMTKNKVLFTLCEIDENDGKNLQITFQIPSALTTRFSAQRLLSVAYL